MSRPGFQRRAGAPPRWNHNLHYHPLVLRAIPPHARTALDVGCGEGALTRELAGVVDEVTGIDGDAASIAAAGSQAGGLRIDYVRGDFLTHPFTDGSFDVVTSVATLHHVDAAAGLTRLRALVAPGGVLAVLGLARSTVREWPLHLVGAVEHRVLSRRRGFWEHPSPKVWTYPLSYPELRRLSADLLPGSRFRRHPLWRYSIVWTRPAGRGGLPMVAVDRT